ncbi:M16 family metallopeptidase [Paenisporosarcina cavernae]|uniref:Insulinase family protein n=1 Tax=Paenisporosarcina cavernae TaxID=2320858 RepID=A0A385YVQ8_9BACL|nr:pitrilysin family protein [Paenisporosarcina cavernae]AYC30776.1 insulinase family protein [Paenisporosarcina cavernae]
MIETIHCSNGVRIVAEKMEHLRSTAIGIWVKVGSVNETPNENGMTHFIEHMLFKGTKSHSAKQLAQEFDRIGGNMNAFTSKEYTCYYAKVLDHHAPKAIDLLADMFFHSVFDKVELDKERQVVAEEILMVEDTPDDDVHEQLWKIMYPSHSIGRSILGSEETLQTFDEQAIREFMDQHYVPENIVISIAGSIPTGFISYIESLFGSFSQKEDKGRKEIKETTPLFHAGESVKIRETEQSHLCLGYPALDIHDQRLMDLVIFSTIFGGNMSSRLFQEVREEKALAYSIYSYHSAYQQSGTFSIYGGTSTKQLPLLQTTIQETIDQVVQNGVSEDEVESTKEQLKGNILLGSESSSSRMNRNGKNILMFHKTKSYNEVEEEINAVTTESVNALQRSILTSNFATSIITSK